jgi:ankyrin repeat protein
MEPGEGYVPYPGVVRDLEGAPEIADVLAQGADVNWPAPEGYTALMFAANVGLVENVKTLLAHGADAAIKAKNGATALSMAERESSVNREERQQIVELLKEHLANQR